MAQSLASGGGHDLPFAWTWLTSVTALPHPAIDYWRPGTAYFLLAVAPFIGVTLFSGAVVQEVLSIGIALAAAAMARQFTPERTVATAAYLIGLTLSPLWWAHLTPDSMILYGCLVGWFLVLVADPGGGPGRMTLVLLLVAAATLTRNDAVLLGVPLAVSIVIAVHRLRRSGETGWRPFSPLLALALFPLALLPAHLLNAAFLGNADSGSLKIALFVTDLRQFQWYGHTPGIDGLPAEGWGRLLALRAEAVAVTAVRIMRHFDQVATFAAAAGAVLLLIRPGCVRNPAALMPAAGFVLAAFAAYTLVMPGIGTHAFLRTYFGLLPVLAALAALALWHFAPSPRAATAGLMLILLFSTVDGLSHARRLLAENAGARDRMVTVASVLEGMPVPGRPVRVLIDDPAQFHVTTGVPALPLPSNGVPAVARAALDHRVSHVVAPRALGPDLMRALGGAAVEVPGTDLMVLPLDPQPGGGNPGNVSRETPAALNDASAARRVMQTTSIYR
ncbi:hypothetical protein [Azospirillum halopraeferens]|uniref:hypothetical protein n=1 Tax=Azospirillum halopraeferens TaxID=34010 RepID=UPI00048DB9EC|nr:hypothetical protein [Azospirillum halopraeferens]